MRQALSLSASEPARAWGREGHETIAKIAERNLTKRAKKRIEKYLGGHSVVYYAKWMDEYRQTPEYAFTNDWHTAPVGADLRYGDELLKPGKGNAVYGLELAIRNLRDYRNLTDSAVAVNLKYVIHLVGDMHCPAHIKYTTHNTKYDVLFEDKYHKPHKYYVHHVWDNEIITTTRIWSVTEWAGEPGPRIEAGEGRRAGRHAARLAARQRRDLRSAVRVGQARRAAGTGLPEQGPAAGRTPDPQRRLPAGGRPERAFSTDAAGAANKRAVTQDE